MWPCVYAIRNLCVVRLHFPLSKYILLSLDKSLSFFLKRKKNWSCHFIIITVHNSHFNQKITMTAYRFSFKRKKKKKKKLVLELALHALNSQLGNETIFFNWLRKTIIVDDIATFYDSASFEYCEYSIRMFLCNFCWFVSLVIISSSFIGIEL